MKTPFPSQYEAEEALCAAGTLYPENYPFHERGKAGVAKRLSQEILNVSAVNDSSQLQQLLNQHRHGMQEFENQAETVIRLVFPNTTDDEMQNWTVNQFMKKLAQAEFVMKDIWGMPFEFASEKEEEQDDTEERPPTMKEIGDDIREQGGDPMIVLQDRLVRKRDEGYVPFPLIGGTKLLQNEEALENVRQQLQELPE
jgi:hypothetical protein